MNFSLSVCSSRRPVDFYWRATVDGRHINAALAKSREVLEANGYQFNRMQLADFEARIEDTLECAEQGQLEPIEHVKRILGSPEIDMFEIRWQDISANKVDRVSGLVDFATVLLRLYYVEEGQQWVVGIHVHEKKIGNSDVKTRAMQNKEIETAVQHAEQTQCENWGVPELTDLRNPPGNRPHAL